MGFKHPLEQQCWISGTWRYVFLCQGQSLIYDSVFNRLGFCTGLSKSVKMCLCAKGNSTFMGG